MLAGHVDYINVGPAVFYNLRLLTVGDRVSVVGADREEQEFEVVEVQRYRADQAPLDRIFGANSWQGLNLITCAGVYDTRTREYDERLVVYAEKVRPSLPAPIHAGQFGYAE